jgi:hypothetical protein
MPDSSRLFRTGGLEATNSKLFTEMLSSARMFKDDASGVNFNAVDSVNFKDRGLEATNSKLFTEMPSSAPRFRDCAVRLG